MLFRSLNITKKEEVFNYLNALKPQIIINCAAYTAVDKAESDPENAFLINAEAASFIALYARENSVFLVHVSTDYVFDGFSNKAYVENDLTNPLTVYGKSKLKGEMLVSEINPNAVIIRTSWLYSIFGSNFVKTMLRLGSENSEIKVVNDQIGCPTWAKDLAKAIMQILGERHLINGTHLYHYSNEGICSWFEFAQKIISIKKLNCVVKPISTAEFPLPAPRPAYSVLNKSKIIEQFNLIIPHWESSIEYMLNKLQ